MQHLVAIDWSKHDFIGHLVNNIAPSDITHKQPFRTKAFRTFLAHYERQDICEIAETNPGLDAIKKILHDSLLSNENFLPNNVVHDNGQLIMNADEETTNLLFQLMLIVDYESYINSIAEKYSKRNSQLFGALFRAIENFFVDLACASTPLRDDVKPSLNILANDDNSHRTDPKKRNLKLAIRKRPTKKSSKKPAVTRSSSSTTINKSRRKSFTDFAKPERETPIRKSARNAKTVVEESTQPLVSCEKSSDLEEDSMPTTYVKKELLDTYITKQPIAAKSAKVTRICTRRSAEDIKDNKKPKRVRRRIKCTFEGCPKIIVGTPSAVIEHMKSHNKVKPFKCDECDKFFSTPRQAKVHQSVHTGDMPFECDECGKRCRLKGQMVSHKAVHATEATCICEQCGKGFKSRSRLKAHLETHRDKSELPLIKCTFEGCSVMLRNTPSRIRQHMVIHSEVKPFNCEDCGKGFAQKQSLKMHMMYHTGDMPFKCDVCDKKFVLKSGLTDHMTIHTGGRPHKCEQCAATFTQTGSLWNHRRLVHKAKKKRDQITKENESNCSSTQGGTWQPSDNPNSFSGTVPPFEHLSQAFSSIK